MAFMMLAYQPATDDHNSHTVLAVTNMEIANPY